MAGTSETAQREEEILQFWKENRIFEKSVEKAAPNGDFVFYDGPPFATGLPHYGSLLSSIIKDVVPRYKTMRGFRVERRWGWDCHGLPIENLVEKQLKLKTKKDIEKIGIDVFNETARQSVLQFEHDWEKYIDRVGRWVDFRNSYMTMDNTYIESVWWALKQLHEKGLLYEGRKVLMYCPHDETPLAKAEIAADNTYKDITEEAVTAKFKVRDPQTKGLPEHTYILAWTTTPWTLPGNVALAVGKDIEYVLTHQKDGEHYIVAKERLPEGLTVQKYFKGEELLGLQYEPLFEVPAIASHDGKKYLVLSADFVSTHEGTGIVHTAVMYGEDDFALGQKEHLPMVQLLDSGVYFNDLAPEFVRGLYIKKAEKHIIESLEERGLLFSKEMHTHSYPHCWRCGTPLIYNAVPSWFINIQKIKERMLKENEKITWVPEHLKEGRFKHVVENAPDWTISRNRYWASPLPIWKERGGSRIMVIGSLEELKQRVKKSGNRYFVMRHGEAQHMLKNIFTEDTKNEYNLTQKGREQVADAAQNIPRDMPIVIVSSTVLRARQTAEIMAEKLGVSKDDIVFDDRLREQKFGEFDGKSKKEFFDFEERPDWYTARPHGGDSIEDTKLRFGKAIYEYESTYKNSTVIIVSHVIAFHSLIPICEGAQGARLRDLVESLSIKPAQVEEINFVPLPVNKKFELDLHRPYSDSLILLDEEGREYERIPEVVDCWVESGAMPFSELHYPFEHEERFTRRFPGDFIAEYIAQTRTWFYYMHAMGVAMFDSHAFRTVVTTGTILASDGSKMSKSKGNYTDPLALLDRFGADALRLYLMGSVVMQAEDLRFRDDDVRDAHNRVIGILWNSYKFFELYKSSYDGVTESSRSEHPLDRWIRSRLGELVREMTDAFDLYDTPRASRALREFVEDYSTWYIRRSRDRVKANEGQDKQYALATQRDVLLTLSKLIAPLVPFIAEAIYRGIGGERKSVHLEEWPLQSDVDESLLQTMKQAREIVSHALKLRDAAGIKVRQPLMKLSVRKLPESEAIREIIKEEVHVKIIEEHPSQQEETELDIRITPELQKEGMLRDVIRAIQDARKKAGLSVGDRPIAKIATNAAGADFFAEFPSIAKETGLQELKVVQEEGPDSSGIPFPLEITFMS